MKELYLPIPGGSIERYPADDAATEKVIDWDDTVGEMKAELTTEMESMDTYLVHVGHIKVAACWIQLLFQNSFANHSCRQVWYRSRLGYQNTMLSNQADNLTRKL